MKKAVNLVHALRITKKVEFNRAIYQAAKQYKIDPATLRSVTHRHIMHNNIICNEKYGCPWYTKLREKRGKSQPVNTTMKMF